MLQLSGSTVAYDGLASGIALANVISGSDSGSTPVQQAPAPAPASSSKASAVSLAVLAPAPLVTASAIFAAGPAPAPAVVKAAPSSAKIIYPGDGSGLMTTFGSLSP